MSAKNTSNLQTALLGRRVRVNPAWPISERHPGECTVEVVFLNTDRDPCVVMSEVTTGYLHECAVRVLQLVATPDPTMDAQGEARAYRRLEEPLDPGVVQKYVESLHASLETDTEGVPASLVFAWLQVREAMDALAKPLGLWREERS